MLSCCRHNCGTCKCAPAAAAAVAAVVVVAVVAVGVVGSSFQKRHCLFELGLSHGQYLAGVWRLAECWWQGLQLSGRCCFLSKQSEPVVVVVVAAVVVADDGAAFGWLSLAH